MWRCGAYGGPLGLGECLAWKRAIAITRDESRDVGCDAISFGQGRYWCGAGAFGYFVHEAFCDWSAHGAWARRSVNVTRTYPGGVGLCLIIAR